MYVYEERGLRLDLGLGVIHITCNAKESSVGQSILLQVVQSFEDSMETLWWQYRMVGTLHAEIGSVEEQI